MIATLFLKREQNSAYTSSWTFLIFMVEKIFNSKAKTITFAALLIGCSTLISGLLGILKMRLLAGKFDVAFTLDCYFAAFRIPDLISAIIITGGIIVSFLPLFSEEFQKNEKSAWRLTNNMINISFVILAGISFLIWFFAPYLIDFIVPGFSIDQKELTVDLTRIMFIAPLIFALSAVFSGILQHFDRFFAYSLAPILYNVGIIFGILFFTSFFPEDKMIFGVAYGVVFGSLLHLLIQIPPAIKCGFKYQFYFNIRDNQLIKIFYLIIPRMISQASSQINLIVITAIGSLLTAGSVAVFNFANNLYLFPVSIIGVSFAVAAFPSFSRSLVNGNQNEFVSALSLSLRQVILAIVPIGLMCFILRAQIVRVVLGTGEFGWTETRLTAASLGVFSLGIIFAGITPILIRAFFAFKDTKTPAILSVFSVGINILLSFAFVWIIDKNQLVSLWLSSFLKLGGIDDIRVIGLALAVTVTSIVQLVLLFVFLKRKVKEIPLREIRVSFAKVCIGSLVMVVVTYFSLRVALFFVDLTTFGAVLFQLMFAFTFGALAYVTTLYLLHTKELYSLIKR